MQWSALPSSDALQITYLDLARGEQTKSCIWFPVKLQNEKETLEKLVLMCRLLMIGEDVSVL